MSNALATQISLEFRVPTSHLSSKSWRTTGAAAAACFHVLGCCGLNMSQSSNASVISKSSFRFEGLSAVSTGKSWLPHSFGRGSRRHDLLGSLLKLLVSQVLPRLLLLCLLLPCQHQHRHARHRRIVTVIRTAVAA